jgi:CBS domain-containing protein
MINNDGSYYRSATHSPKHEGVCSMIARDIMTSKVCTIPPEASAKEVAQLLSEKRISGVPVVDSNDKLIGIVTEADIISKVNREGLSVADIMSHEVITVEEEAPVGEIATLLTERKIKRVPVVRNGKVVGIVSRADIVNAVAQGHLIIRQW